MADHSSTPRRRARRARRKPQQWPLPRRRRSLLARLLDAVRRALRMPIAVPR